MARLEVEIGGTNDELKKILAESKIELSKFAKEANSSKFNIKFDYAGSKAALADAKAQQAVYRAELDKAKIATEAQREATQRNRAALVAAQEATQQARKRLAELALEQKKSRTETVVATGSYREAQQRLTALGKTIREAEGGFSTSNKAIQAQVVEYRALNEQLKNFDKAMGNNQRNVGNYPQLLGAVSPGLGNLANGFADLGAMGGGGGPMGLAVLGISALAGAFKGAKDTIFNFNDGLLNVSKTTGMTGKELEGMSSDIIALSKSLKVVGTPQLLEYATVAGQLGVKGKENILAFSEALAKLEVASNISGEEGGAEIARLLTLTDGGVQNVKAFGDEIVNLGNNFAATEKEILGNAQAIAQNVGLYDIGRQDILAFATATKSVGIEAELVGSTFGRTLGVLEKAIRTGSGLKAVLATVGGTQAELSNRFKQDASGVFVDFVSGLNKINKEGGNVKVQLEELGIVAVRDQRVIESLAVKGFDTLSKSLDTVKNASGAMGNEFDAASGKLIQQTGRIGIAWDNLILSIDNGTGAIGGATAAMASFFATALEGVTNVVTSRSWKEFFTRINPLNIGKGDVLNDIFGIEDALKKTKEFTTALGKNDVYGVSKGSSVGLGRLSKGQLDKEYLAAKENYENISKAATKYEASVLAGRIKGTQQSIIEYKKQESIAKLYLSKINAARSSKTVYTPSEKKIVDDVLGGDGESASKKSAAAAMKSAEALAKAEETIRLESLDSYSKKLEEITIKYDALRKTGISGDVLGLAKQNEEAERLKVTIDRLGDSLGKIKKVGSITVGDVNLKPTTPLKLAGSESPLSGLSVEGREAFRKWLDEELGKSDDKLNNRISKQIEQAFNSGIGSIISDIDKLGNSFYEVFSNVFTRLASTLNSVFTTAITTQLSGMISKKLNSDDFSFAGMKSNISKAIVAGAGIAGTIVSGATSKTSSLGQGLGGALSGAAAGAIFGPIGAGIGAAIGGISGLFSASKARKQEEEQKKQLEEQKKQTLLLERANALAFQSSITGQMTNQGIVTGVDRNAFGDLTATIKGQDIVLAVKRTEEAALRGY